MKHREEIIILKSHIPNLNIDAHRTEAIGDCPFCGKRDHFFINKEKLLFNCKKCDESGNLKKIANQLGISHLFENLNVKKHSLNFVPIIELDSDESDTEEEIKPLNDFYLDFQKIEIGDKYYKYLLSRKYNSDFIKLRNNLFYKNVDSKDYIYLPVVMDSLVYGYVGRCIWSSEKIDTHNENVELRFVGNDTLIKKLKKKRYSNSHETKFSRLLYGIDEVREGHLVIIVEGFFDWLSVMRMIDRYNLYADISCVCTFGKKMSTHQIKLLQERNIDDVLFLWDYDARPSMRKNSILYKKSFKNVLVSFITEKNKDGEFLDAGDSSPKIILNTIERNMTFDSFLLNTVDV